MRLNFNDLHSQNNDNKIHTLINQCVDNGSIKTLFYSARDYVVEIDYKDVPGMSFIFIKNGKK